MAIDWPRAETARRLLGVGKCYVTLGADNRGMPAYPPLELQPGEREVERVRAAGHAAPGHMPGGRLYLTNMRLIWQPSPYSRRVLRCSEVQLPLSEVDTVDIPSRRWTLTIGGTRSRMHVRMSSGEEHSFMLTMGGLRRYAIRLETLVTEAKSGPGRTG